MKVLGQVTKVENLRGGISVSISMVVDPAVEDPYFKGRPRGSFELSGLTKEAGRQFKAGQEVTLDIGNISDVTVESKGVAIDLTEGAVDDGPQDEASGD